MPCRAFDNVIPRCPETFCLYSVMDPRAYPSGLLPAAGWRVPSLLSFVNALAEVGAETNEVMFVKATQALCLERLRRDGEWSVGIEPLLGAAPHGNGVLVAERKGDLPPGAGGNVTVVTQLALRGLQAVAPCTLEPPGKRSPDGAFPAPAPEPASPAAVIATGPGAVAVAIEATELLLDDALLELHGDVTLLILPHSLAGATTAPALADPSQADPLLTDPSRTKEEREEASAAGTETDHRAAVAHFVSRRARRSDAVLLLTPPTSPNVIHAYNAQRPSVRHWTPMSLAARSSVIAESLELPLTCECSAHDPPIPAFPKLLITGLAPLPGTDPTTHGLDLATLARRVAFLAGLLAALTNG